MKTSTLTKYAAYAIAVLTATLLNEYILKYIKKRITQQGYLLVLIDMLVVVLIFAPAFGIVSAYTKKFSKAYLKTSKKAHGGSSKRGVIIGFIIAGGILFLCYAHFRHNLNTVNDISNWIRLKMAT